MEDVKGIDVLALDLEGTLISNAMSQIARPGLREFLEFCGDNKGRYKRHWIGAGDVAASGMPEASMTGGDPLHQCNKEGPA